jgi:hypothetical protein
MKKNKNQKKYFPSPIQTTLMPNGDLFICATGNKLSKMGNIENKKLDLMYDNLKNTIFYKVLSEGCGYISNFLSPIDEKCGICRSQPLDENFEFSKETNGRVFLYINEKTELENFLEKVRKLHRDLIISVRFKEPKIRNEYINNLENFFNTLVNEKINFILSRPIPPCIKIETKFDKDVKPKNCFECRELFTVKSGFLRLCPFIHDFKGSKFKELKNRNEVYRQFENGIGNTKINSECENCIYFLRKQCDGRCFREII